MATPTPSRKEPGLSPGDASSQPQAPRKGKSPRKQDASPSGIVLKGLLWLFGLLFAGGLAAAMGVAFVLAVAFPNLPDVSELADYRPKLPLRVYSADKVLMGEFGEERREFVPIEDIPLVLTRAVLAAEDANFFSHNGVDMKGMARAVLANFGRAKSQGASTISMQVARNVYLSAEKTYTRKIYEVLMTFKLEYQLSKAQILQIYMNQIYLGRRAYGFAAASRTYFDKQLDELSIAEAAMLAGLPKAPSAYNPIRNPTRARARQLYIIERMAINGFITKAEAEVAKQEKLVINRPSNDTDSDGLHAEYAAEMARLAIYSQYGDEAYTRGINVYTTINAKEQHAAYTALRNGLLDFGSRQTYRGPEANIVLPEDPEARAQAIDDALADVPDNGDLVPAVVLSASSNKVTAQRQDGDVVTLTGKALVAATSALRSNAQPKVRVRAGSIIRLVKRGADGWAITQTPEVEGALVSLNPTNNHILALVGGFDFGKSKFNHVTQAWRQPGSSFKPFIYSAALEKGITPGTIVNDAPLFYTAEETGGEPWEPKNYDGKFEGPMPIRSALAKSKNMVSIRVLQVVGPQSAQDWIKRFGFDAKKHPPYLTMALGAGSATPIQLATGYSVFANGGHLLPPQLITRITDQRGHELFKLAPTVLDDTNRVISKRNAFVMGDMLQEVARSGTAAKSQRELKRADLYGKTGTTNDSQDAWFVGYQPTRVAAVWVGYDTPRNLGNRETGGGLSLPIWIDYMRVALQDTPEQAPVVPSGVFSSGGEWYFSEMGPNNSIRTLGMLPDGTAFDPAADGMLAPSEKSGILDLFRQ
jgi:penicillin-binding protein 1A